MAINFSSVVAMKISSYDQLSYIHFNGTDNFLPSGMYFNQSTDTTIEITFSVDDLSAGTILGNGDNILHLEQYHLKFGYSTIADILADTVYTVRIRRIVGVYSDLTLFQGGEEIASLDLSGTTFTTNNLYIFSDYNYYNSSVRNYKAGKLYSVKYKNVDMAPAINKATGVICLCGYWTDPSAYGRYLQGTISSSSTGEVVTPTVSLPSVEVKKITDSQDNILWEAGPRLTSITLSGYNTSLSINSNFIYGGTVTANYSDGTTADVTLDTTFTGYDMATAGEQTVTASYTDSHGVTKTATYTLTVVAVGWHTLWEGSQTVSVSNSTISGTVSNLCSSEPGTGNRPNIRITFTNFYGYGGDYATNYFYLNGSSYSQSTAPTSPYTISSLSSSTNTHVMKLERHGSYNDLQVALMKTYDSTDDNVDFSLTASRSNGTNATVTLTVTKIEQYY